jgi:Domain of unknown function (DU1801)
MTNKTQPTNQSVEDFLKNYPNKESTQDYLDLLKIFSAITNKPAVLWGKIVGFGNYHYKYASGREGDWFVTGFAPSKTGFTIYNIPGYEHTPDLLAKLGKYKMGKSCLYVKKLTEIDIKVLDQIITKGLEYMEKNYKTK